ncbi:MAG: class A beta-lactamase-related serine hydrolase [Flavobacteriaceae bacterium]|nr:class A beta-lactamase-related serine hydrolase [Flavobacteriaceae bacterium]
MTLKPTFLFTKIVVLFFLCLSCNSKNKKYNSSDVASINMKPSDSIFPVLSDYYINSKKNKIQLFFNKNWPSKNNNVSFLVAKDGQIIYENYVGFIDIKKKTPITSETSIHIASVSKVITATAILKLINVGKLELDQKVTTLLKGFPYSEITIKNLLSHRSGMRNYTYFTNEKGIWDTHKIMNNQDVLNVMITKKISLEYKPNTRFGYCNTNYAMLALVIEKVTGKKYSDAMKTMIFEPLGMTQTFVYDYKKNKELITPSYRNNGQQIAFDYLDAVYGDKNIFSTPRDLLKFDMARNSDYFLSPELRHQIYKGCSNEYKGQKNYGLGIRMINFKTGQNFYFHNGWWHGNMSSYITLKKENVTIIALTNKCSKNVYKVRNLAPLFGDYPFKVDENEDE